MTGWLASLGRGSASGKGWPIERQTINSLSHWLSEWVMKSQQPSVDEVAQFNQRKNLLFRLSGLKVQRHSWNLEVWSPAGRELISPNEFFRGLWRHTATRSPFILNDLDLSHLRHASQSIGAILNSFFCWLVDCQPKWCSRPQAVFLFYFLFSGNNCARFLSPQILITTNMITEQLNYRYYYDNNNNNKLVNNINVTLTLGRNQN